MTLKDLPFPFGNAVLAVARNAAEVIGNGFALFQQTIEEGGFSNIGTAYDSNCIWHFLLIYDLRFTIWDLYFTKKKV